MADNGADPSGVPVPIAPSRAEAARENSGIIVGTAPVATQTTVTTGAQSSQTAFIKVYQDAGVIGVAMITMLALCLGLTLFCARLIKMYSALTESRDSLENIRSQAIEKLATATLLLKTEVMASVAEVRREHSDHVVSLADFRREASVAMSGADRAFRAIEEVLVLCRAPCARGKGADA